MTAILRKPTLRRDVPTADPGTAATSVVGFGDQRCSRDARTHTQRDRPEFPGYKTLLFRQSNFEE
jgi:hypothetical protein